ncbi:OsmC family protein [Risungbinella massiliensis]|uniref:OsmC family protein n=1 Tax=Risungbinella massiliensis TaxID=1329796 RepID=UPI0005CC72E9|nr:OsmC family protein [Risungbinella massiliensis]
MKVNVEWKQQMQFESHTPSGHQIIMDASEESGGANTGPRPTEILLGAVGTCTGIDIVEILRKMRLPLERFDLNVSGERAEEHPRKFTQIHLEYHLSGDLPADKVKRAIELSVEKYCSVSHSLSAKIHVSYTINGQLYRL